MVDTDMRPAAVTRGAVTGAMISAGCRAAAVLLGAGAFTVRQAYQHSAKG